LAARLLRNKHGLLPYSLPLRCALPPRACYSIPCLHGCPPPSLHSLHILFLLLHHAWVFYHAKCKQHFTGHGAGQGIPHGRDIHASTLPQAGTGHSLPCHLDSPILPRRGMTFSFIGREAGIQCSLFLQPSTIIKFPTSLFTYLYASNAGRFYWGRAVCRRGARAALAHTARQHIRCLVIMNTLRRLLAGSAPQPLPHAFFVYASRHSKTAFRTAITCLVVGGLLPSAHTMFTYSLSPLSTLLFSRAAGAKKNKVGGSAVCKCSYL